MKKLIKSHKFWVSFAGALGLLTVTINKHFGITINAKGVEEIVMAICGVLIVLGIVKKDKTQTNSNLQQSDENTSQNQTEKEQNETENTNKNSLEK